MEEVKGAIFELGEDNVLGLNGFPIQFFRNYWDTIKGDLLNLCKDFYAGHANLERINWASIALIP